MERLGKKIKGRCFRKVVIYFLTWCMVLNTSLPAVLAEVVLQPDGIKNGTITVNPLGGGITQDMTASDGAIGHFSDFDIAAGHAVTCVQPGANANALFRIFSGDGTQILGQFDATGNIFLIDPAGILFGANSQVNVNRLVASSLDIDNGDFLAGDYLLAGEGIGEVANYGTINAIEGAALIGKRVLNAGTITTGEGGFVVMAAGDRVLIGEPGSKIVVEMDSVTLTDPENPEGFGDVVNEGEITAPGGTVVLAAGDIFSVPLHPQLRVNSGTAEEPVYEVADQPVRVESGIGTVTQSGTIDAGDIGGGSVILTAGDEVTVAIGSITQAVGGEVLTYAYDFGTKEATTSFEDGAVINVGTGTAEISGNHVLFAGSVDALPGGTIQVDPLTLTIADTMPVTGPELDTLYEEEHIEFYSQAGVNLDLAADELITVEYMADSDVVGEITGGSGDIYLRNIFADGGIYFEQEDEAGQTGPRSSIRTEAYYESAEVYRDGGNIYMDAGSGGIVAGDLFTGTKSQDKMSQPGEIVLRTANGGDIEVGTMKAEGASSTQVSAISGGDLIVNGNVESINKQTDNDETSVFKAIMCLIAEGDIDLNGNNYEVSAHGKGLVSSDIRISAGQNVTIGAENSIATIKAESKVSGTATHSTAYIVIHAGRNLEGSGVISINGQSYTPGEAYLMDGDITAKAWPGPLSIETDGIPTTDGTESVWQDPVPPPEPVDFFAKIEINSNAPDLSQCADCPRPPGLPPVPTLFIIFDDSFTFAKNSENESVDVLANDDDGSPLVDGTVWEYTTTTGGGTLIEIPGGGEVTSFEYTPPEDAVFIWDGESDYAEFTDTFTYKAEDAEGNVSVNTATVTITVMNFLPVADGGFATTPKADNVDVTEATAAGSDLIEFVIGSDIDDDFVWISSYDAPAHGTLTPIYDTVDPTKIVGFTYDPPDDLSAASFDSTGFDDAYDSFTYTVTDGYNFSTATVENPGAVQINLTNELPVANPDNYDVLHNVNLSQAADQGIITGVVPAVNGDSDADGDLLTPFLPGTLTTGPTDLGGTVTLSSDGSFTYEPPADTVGTDSFTYYVTDGYNNSEPVQVTIDLTNTLPVAQPDSYEVVYGTPLSPAVDQGVIEGVIPAINGDYDPDPGDSLAPYLPGALTTGPTDLGGTVTLNPDGSFTYTPPASFSGTDSFTYYVTDGYGNSEPVQVTMYVGSPPPVPVVPYMQPAPGLQREVVEISGCPALVKWVASELGTDETKIQIWMANALASARDIQPCDACVNLKEAATILQDVDGTRVAALADVINEFASSTAPPTEEQMASIADAIANDIEGNRQYAAAGEYLDALAKYVGILNSEMGFSADESVQFATDNYVGQLAEGESMGVAAYVAARLAALGGS